MNLEHPPRLDLQLDVALGFTPARKRCDIVALVDADTDRRAVQFVNGSCILSRIVRSLVADSDPEPFPLQESIADEEKPVALHTPFRCFKPTAMNESQEASRTESLSQSVATSTEMQLLNGEIVYLRQRLQMEILANQELEQVLFFVWDLLFFLLFVCLSHDVEKVTLCYPRCLYLSNQMVESTLELFSHFSPAGSGSLNQSSALEAYDSIKRSLQVTTLLVVMTFFVRLNYSRMTCVQDRIFARQQKISALYKTQMV